MKIRLLLRTLVALALVACGKETETPAAAPDARAAAGQKVNAGRPVDGDAQITVPDTASAGSTIEVKWTGPANTRDYIDIVPRGNTLTSDQLVYAYIPNSIPTASLRVPTSPGEYDVRYVVALETESKVKATAPLTVTPVTATLTVPAEVEAADFMSIAWTGPDGKGDYVDIVPAGHAATSGEITYVYTSAGNPAKLKAPGAIGSYDVRYLLEGTGGRKVLAAGTVKVKMPEATLKAPDRVRPSEDFIVEWTGPKREGDYVDLVKKGYTATGGEINYFYADRNVPNQLKAPAEPGDYDIRYILQAPNIRVVLTRRQITVR